MFCTKCGKQIPDSTKFCPYCGANCSPEQDIASQASQVFNKAEQELGSAFNEVKQSFTGSNNQNNNQGYNANQNYSNGYNNGTIPPYSGTRLKDDRGLASYIILSIITCGIYSYYFIYKMAHDVNIACEGDGENTSGLVAFILLSLITCGIYAWFWYYNLGIPVRSVFIVPPRPQIARAFFCSFMADFWCFYLWNWTICCNAYSYQEF